MQLVACSCFSLTTQNINKAKHLKLPISLNANNEKRNSEKEKENTK